MPLAPGLLEQVAAQLAHVPELSVRRMFGGAGLYSAGVFFGVIADGAVFFRVDDGNREEFARAGAAAFEPVLGKLSTTYFQVPEEVVAQPGPFAAWALKAITAARAAKAGKAQRASRQKVPHPRSQPTQRASMGRIR